MPKEERTRDPTNPGILVPNAFGFLGDPKQLGPTILSTAETKSFRSQLVISLRLITAGYDVGKLIVQRRLAGDIYDLVTTVFHGNASWDYKDGIDLTGLVNHVKRFNRQNLWLPEPGHWRYDLSTSLYPHLIPIRRCWWEWVRDEPLPTVQTICFLNLFDK